jgi:hypothetical protein
MQKIIAVALAIVAFGAATAQAKVNLYVNLNAPAAVPSLPPPALAGSYPPQAPASSAPPLLGLEEPPRFIFSPSLGFYVSVEIPYDIVYVDRLYYLYSGGYWYLSSAYWGPWSIVPLRSLPMGLRKHRYQQIRSLRDSEYQVFLQDRGHYRGGWYRPEGRAGMGHRMERKGERREEPREERREERR